MDPSPPPAEARRWVLPGPVIVLGLVSLFTDVSGEMIVPLLPAFLAQSIAHPALVLGLMEGLADATSAGLKLVSGRWVDRGRALKPLVVTGYVLASAVRPLMGFAHSVYQPILIRVTDRFGKGIRTSPRDAMIARFTDVGTRGRAFGFHNAMDHTGAALGALLALTLSGLGVPVAKIFLWSAVPAVLAVAAVLATREPPRSLPAGGSHRSVPMPRRLWAFLVPVTLFGLGNSTDAFVLLKLTELGAKPLMLPAAWLLIHVVKAVASYPAGVVADRLTPARVVLTGWCLYALSYGLLAVSGSVKSTLAIIGFYGFYHALSEGTEKALLIELAPEDSRGRALGAYHALSGGASLAAGLLFGTLWTTRGSTVAFSVAGVLAAVSAGLLAVMLPRARATA